MQIPVTRITNAVAQATIEKSEYLYQRPTQTHSVASSHPFCMLQAFTLAVVFVCMYIPYPHIFIEVTRIAY